jgi:O-antigen biosynthesis protein WbqP
LFSGRWIEGVKRAFDVVGAAFGLLIAVIPIAILVLMIRRGSEGPGIFSQQRVGRDGRLFHCHKLRTMRAGTPHVPTHEAAAAQITPLGAILRRTKLDELPQLWNVLTGEMSFVGPRPCLPSQTVLIEERRKRGVLSLRPGITGLAQIRGIDMSDPLRLAETDAEYLHARNFGLDLAILFRTFFSVLGAGQDRLSSR